MPVADRTALWSEVDGGWITGARSVTGRSVIRWGKEMTRGLRKLLNEAANLDPAGLKLVIHLGSREVSGVVILTKFLTLGWLITAAVGGVAGAQEAPVISLSEALDTGGDVTWTTSVEKPFIGQPISGTLNGSAAYLIMGADESWLEATVQGEGRLQFRVSGSTGAGTDGLSPWYLATRELWVDGVKLDQTANDVRLTRAGEHRVRLVVKNTSGYPLGIWVDKGIWSPTLPGTADDSWTSSSPDAIRFFSNGGIDDSAMISLEDVPGDGPWIEKNVTGPGVFEWHSYGEARSGSYSQPVHLTVDGIGRLPVQTNSQWAKQRLTIPAGAHRIRWSRNPDADETVDDVPGVNRALWQVSGVSFTSAKAPIQEVMGSEGMWLVTGEEDGAAVPGEGAGSLAFLLPVDSTLHYCNFSPRIQKISGRILIEGQERWRTDTRVVTAGESLIWGMSDRHYEVQPQVAAVSVEDFEPVAVSEAVDHAEGISSDSWLGVRSPKSSDGEDLAWSSKPGSVVSMTPPGTGRLKFRWKKSGPANLVVRVNGGVIPVPPVTADWAEVEMQLGGGENLVEWVHGESPSEDALEFNSAMLDTISFEPVIARTLDQAAAGGTILGLSNSDEAPPIAFWNWVIYEEASGDLVDAARVTGGASAMTATIQGPAAVAFNGRCFDSLMQPAGRRVSPRVEIGGELFLRDELMVEVDGVPLARIAGSAWETATFNVPRGAHRVAWKLNGVYRDIASGHETVRASTTSGTQGWVRGISVKRSRAFYNDWAVAHALQEGLSEPEQDADGDGAGNLMEFAFGSDPNDRSSKPESVFGTMAAGPSGNFRLFVPYLWEQSGGVLERSDDLKSWEEVPLGLLSARPALGSPLPHTATHQAIEFPRSPDHVAGFFRVKVMLSDQ